MSLFCQGACESAREHLEEAVALYFGHRESFPVLSGMDAGVNCLAWLSVTLCVLGFPEQGLARGNEAVRLAEDLALPFSQGMALAVAGCVLSMYRRDVPGSQRRAVELLALSQEKGAPLLRQWVELTLGWVQVENGEYEAGCDRIKRTIQSWRQMGTVFGSIWHLALLADAHRGAGQVEQGLARVEDAMALLPRMGFSHQEPELHRIRGELLQAKGEPAQEVEACFQRAIEVARRHGTRWFELRAMVSLARFRRTADAARRQEAREMLADVYAWFSEGFDLPNLVEARELLAEL